MSKTTDETGKRLGFNYTPQIWQWTGPQGTTNRSGCRDFQGKRRMAAGYSLLQPLNSTHDGHFLEIRIYPLDYWNFNIKKTHFNEYGFPVLCYIIFFTLSCFIWLYLVSHVYDSFLYYKTLSCFTCRWLPVSHFIYHSPLGCGKSGLAPLIWTSCSGFMEKSLFFWLASTPGLVGTPFPLCAAYSKIHIQTLYITYWKFHHYKKMSHNELTQ